MLEWWPADDSPWWWLIAAVIFGVGLIIELRDRKFRDEDWWKK